MNPDMGSFAVGGGTKGCQLGWGWHCLHTTNSLVLEDHYSAVDYSFVSKIRIFVWKIFDLFTIELRYREYIMAVSSSKDIKEEKEEL